jgi:uncharacterized protein
MRTITLEEHFATLGFLDGPGRDLKEQAGQIGSRAERLMRDLCDIGEGRIAKMDAAGIDMQVVSLNAPGVEQLEAAEAVTLVRDTNDALVEAIAKQPTRLSGFAALPIAVPDQAAKELAPTETGCSLGPLPGRVRCRRRLWLARVPPRRYTRDRWKHT